jgi:hypothetical protein
MEIGFAEAALAAAATWRITHLLHAEDGPWDVFVRLRKLAGDGAFGKMLDCFYCISAWVALPIAFALGLTWKARVLLWPALSGAAILLERATDQSPHGAASAMWHEEPEPQPWEGEKS